MITSKNSLFVKILFTLLLAAILEGSLFLGALSFSKAFESIRDDSISLFEQRISFRSSMLHKTLIENLYNEGNFEKIIKACKTLYETHDKDKTIMLGEEELNNLLTLTQSRTITGAYIILDEKVFHTDGYPALYLKDSSPDAYHKDGSDLSARFGDASLLKEHNLTLDANWSSNMNINDVDDAYKFYTIPFQEAHKNPGLDTMSYAYWGDPIHLENDIENYITYSFPLIADDGTIFGVAGVDISSDMLKTLLNYDELNDENQKAYVIAKKNDKQYSVVFCNGPAYSYALKSGTQLSLNQTYSANTKVLDIDDSNVLASAVNLSLYPSNSPFEKESWYLIGIADKDELLRSSNQLKHNSSIAIGLAVIIGIGAAVLISIIFTRPIKRMIKQLKNINVEDIVSLPRVNIDEIDDLCASIEELSQNLLSAESRMSQILHATEFPIGAIESFGKDTYYVTEKVAELLDFPEELHNKVVIPITAFTNAFDTFETYAQLVESHEEVKDNKKIDVSVYCYQPPNREKRWLRITYSDQKGVRVFIVMDVSKEFFEKEKLTYERDHDALTCLLNRNAFHKQVETVLKQEDIGTAAMVLWDLDNLKFINDTYGHNLGDQLIIETAAILSSGDHKHCIASRMAGDEFLLFFHHYANTDDVLLEIQRLHLKLISKQLYVSDREIVNIKVSAGIAWYPDDAQDYETLLRYSDFAMYDVKNSQKGSVHSFDINMYQSNEKLFSGRKELTLMLENQNIRYAYQPIINAHDGSILGFEALMRPQGKILTSPADVLRLARAQSQLYRIEYMTWINAIETFHNLCENCPHTHLFINSISSIPLRDDLISTLENHYEDILPRVVIELLETDEMNPIYLKEKQDFMKKWNGSIAIDDFGSGHNADTVLLKVDTDYIKIDIELIRNIDKDNNRQVMVKNIIKIAHQKQIKVIAEGIERKEELETLLSFDVDYLQGYYLAKPDFHLHPIADDIKTMIIEYHQHHNKI